MSIEATIEKNFGSFQLNVSFSGGNEVLAILGGSGCGKSMTLRCIAGIVRPDRGRITVDGVTFFDSERNINLPPQQRRVGLLFQNYALFHNMTVEENIAAGVREKLPQKEKLALARQSVSKFRLDGLEHHLPRTLSGGQQQRVALARALVIEPSVLLFDEPLSNLDAKLRVTMRTEIRKIQQKVGITAIYVTHDQSEAMSISDKIIIMSKGKVEQIGTPREIYYHPNSRFVADFIGEANFLDARVRSASGEKAVIDVVGQELTVNNFAKAGPGDDAVLVIRPEGATLAEQGLLEGTVTLSTFMGSYQYYQVMVGNMEIQITDYNPVNRRIYEVGEKAYLDFDPKGVYIL